MGYESKLYIVKKNGNLMDDNGMRYAEIIAEFDMCKCPPIAYMFGRMPKTDCYIYADDGNTKILEDMYGDSLTEAPLCKVIKTVEDAIANGYDYRRYPPLLACLKVFWQQEKEYIWDDIAVLHYGY